MTDLDELKKSAKQMEQLKLVIEDKQLQKVFVSFLEKYVIHNTTSNFILKHVILI